MLVDIPGGWLMNDEYVAQAKSAMANYKYDSDRQNGELR